MQETETKRPEVVVVAGPNGSGKSTFSMLAKPVGTYINADDIKRCMCCTDLEAVQRAEQLREHMLETRQDFTFETVLSTERNLLLLERAKRQGYFVRAIYVLTASPDINVLRVRSREQNGGHGVPEEKIRVRYCRSLQLLPRLAEVCNVLNVYDNTDVPVRIFKKRAGACFSWESEDWSLQAIAALTESSVSHENT